MPLLFLFEYASRVALSAAGSYLLLMRSTPSPWSRCWCCAVSALRVGVRCVAFRVGSPGWLSSLWCSGSGRRAGPRSRRLSRLRHSALRRGRSRSGSGRRVRAVSVRRRVTRRRCTGRAAGPGTRAVRRRGGGAGRCRRTPLFGRRPRRWVPPDGCPAGSTPGRRSWSRPSRARSSTTTRTRTAASPARCRRTRSTTRPVTVPGSRWTRAWSGLAMGGGRRRPTR